LVNEKCEQADPGDFVNAALVYTPDPICGASAQSKAVACDSLVFYFTGPCRYRLLSPLKVISSLMSWRRRLLAFPQATNPLRGNTFTGAGGR
jgi:hypothetical protein